MKISLKWLSEYLDATEFYKNPEKLDTILTAAGLEVESIENQKEKLQNVVVGKIIELGKHPDADKLTLCQLDCGEGSYRQIVCGARNHRQGDKVAVATPGAVLPGDFAIKKSKIRGVESLGMLCSETELGLADKSEGILILNSEAPIGQEFSVYAGFDDIVFELSVTPNRADCLSHIGLARELACLLNRPLKLPVAEFKKGKFTTKEEVDIELKNSDLCPRYSARVVKGIKVGPSPAWLKSRLKAVDINSINNVVDITNFVMLEYGQPMHAFDLNQIKGGKIKIENSTKGEKFQSLDGSEYILDGSELMIRDGARAVALAGVVGGLNSGVTDKTTDIVLESAHFVPQTVRKTSRKFGINTDSGYRFSRGTDPDAVITALDRATHLLVQVCGGTSASEAIDSYPQPKSPCKIEITQKTLEERIGYSVSMVEFNDWMKRLGCKVESQKDKSIVTAPLFRWDLTMDMDLVEEYARLNGYDKLPETLPSLQGAPTQHTAEYTKERFLGQAMIRAGYQQAVNYSFVSGEFQKQLLKGKNHQVFNVLAAEEAVAVVNPLNDETNVMRVTMASSLLKNLIHNYRHDNSYGRLFELGQCFSKSESGYSQYPRLGLLAWGHASGLWTSVKSAPTVLDIKAALESVLRKLNAKNWDWREIAEQDIPAYLHPSQCASLFYQGKLIGYIGSLHPSLKQEWKIREDVAIGEVNIDLLMSGFPKLPKLEKMSKFPIVERDLTFLVPNSTPVAAVEREIVKVIGVLGLGVVVFDIFSGPGVESGQRAVTFKMWLQDKEGTLNEEQLTGLQTKVITSVKKSLGIDMR